MTAAETKQFILGEWESLAIELRPVKDRTGSGEIKPFYVWRAFNFLPGERFECTAINYADPLGKVPLVKIVIKGHNVWNDANPIVADAYNVDYVADEAYEITPLHPAFADGINKAPTKGVNAWEVGVMQDIKGKAFAAFGLADGQIYIDYDLIYVLNDLLFMGSKHVNGQAFDKPEFRPTNLQIPLKRKQ